LRGPVRTGLKRRAGPADPEMGGIYQARMRDDSMHRLDSLL
jgi:hypothetical protein